MQVRGLPRHVTRGAALASRLGDAERSEAARRRDALARWASGPVPGAERPPRRPVRSGCRAPRCIAGRGGLSRASRRPPRDGAARTTRCGARPSSPSCCSARDTGCQREHGRAHPQEADGPRRGRARCRPCAARRRVLPAAHAPMPGACPGDTDPQHPARSSSSTPLPSRSATDDPPSSSSPPAIPSPGGPAPRHGEAPPPTTQPRFLDKLPETTCPSPYAPSRSTAARSSRPGFETECHRRGIDLFELPPGPPNSTAMSSATTAHGAMSSTQHGNSRMTSTASTNGSTPSRDEFNTFRPHQALGGQTPAQYLAKTNSQRNLPVSYVLN